MLAWWGSRLLVLMASAGPEPLPLDVTPNARILGFTLLASFALSCDFRNRSGIARGQDRTELCAQRRERRGAGYVAESAWQGARGRASCALAAVAGWGGPLCAHADQSAKRSHRIQSTERHALSD